MSIFSCVTQPGPPNLVDGGLLSGYRGARGRPCRTGCCTTPCRSEVSVDSVHFVISIGYSQFGNRCGFVLDPHDRLPPRSPVLQCHKSIGESFQRIYLRVDDWSYLSRLEHAGTRVRIRGLRKKIGRLA